MDDIKSVLTDIVDRLERIENIIHVNDDLIRTNIELNKVAKIQHITPIPKLKMETRIQVKCIEVEKNMIILSGQTYDIKDRFKEHGATWHSQDPKGWQIPSSKLPAMCTDLKTICNFDTSSIPACEVTQEDMIIDCKKDTMDIMDVMDATKAHATNAANTTDATDATDARDAFNLK